MSMETGIRGLASFAGAIVRKEFMDGLEPFNFFLSFDSDALVTTRLAYQRNLGISVRNHYAQIYSEIYVSTQRLTSQIRSNSNKQLCDKAIYYD